MFTLLKNTDLYCPEHVGRTDVLLAHDKIVAIEQALNVTGLSDVTVIDCGGRMVAPGLIDQHIHLKLTQLLRLPITHGLPVKPA